MLIVLTTIDDRDAGLRMAESLVLDKLAACVQVLPKMTSVYFWEGVLQQEEEHLLLIKTTKEKFSALKEFIQRKHRYDAPEIVAVESKEVSEKYREWLEGYLNE